MDEALLLGGTVSPVGGMAPRGFRRQVLEEAVSQVEASRWICHP
jgi:hypothetical protein